MAILMCFYFQSIFTGYSYYTYLIAQVHSLLRPCQQAINAVHFTGICLMNAYGHAVMEIMTIFS